MKPLVEIGQIVRSRRKTVGLIVKGDGTLVVRAPMRVTRAQIVDVVNRKADWIRAKQARARTMAREAAPKRYVNGESFWYLGQAYPLEIVPSARAALVLDGRFYLAQRAHSEARSTFEGWYRRQARQVISGRVAGHASRLGVHPGRVRITSARTRWGSCSSRGTLSFPWRLVLAPMPVIDYVVVHELVHLLERNHSKAFWAQVEKILPDYRQRKEWLKRNGHLLALN